MSEKQIPKTPWQPLYTIERSGITEVSVYGIVSVVEGTASRDVRQLLEFGDVNYMLWSRSLLKPWQLLSHFQELIDHYPALTDEHLTLMLSSHSAEAPHLKLLNEILAIGAVSDHFLKCPATFPLSNEMRIALKEQGEIPRSTYHNCSGKHSGYLLSMKTEGLDLDDYLNPEGAQFVVLKELLCNLTGRSVQTFGATTDGCQLPNYGLTPYEMAKFYQGLACGIETSDKRTAQLKTLADLMRDHPFIVGGSDRFDSRLMNGKYTNLDEVPLVAKEGADGLLGIGIGRCRRFENGLGILIKLSSGNDTKHMETIVQEVLRQLGLLVPKPEKPVQVPQCAKIM